MKIREKDRKINVDRIFIEDNNGYGVKIGLIVNSQYIEIITNKIYVNNILDYINLTLDSMYESLGSYQKIERLDIWLK